MAEKVSIIVELKNKASAGLKSITSGIGNLAKAPFNLIGKGVSGIAGAMTSLGGLLTGAALIGGVKKATDLWREQNRVLKQTEAALKSTGGASGLTAEEINKMAGELQKVTNFGDEVTQSGQNLLLTFTNIGKDVFPQATETMLNMSQTMGQDVKSSAIQLGKALNDPIKGVAALSRVGVQLTDQQKEQITILQESGDIVGAQTVILKELETQFGGSARAAKDSMTQMGNNIGDVGEIIGKTLQPAFDLFANGVSNWINKGNAEKFAEQMGNGVTFIIDNLNNLKKVFSLLVRAVSIAFNEILTNVKIFAASAEEIIKRPFQFSTYKNIFTALVDRIADLAKRTIELSRDLLTKGIGAIKAFREKLFKDEEASQETFEQKIQKIKDDSKKKQTDIENNYQSKLKEIESDELNRKKTLELKKTEIEKGESDNRKQIAKDESDFWRDTFLGFADLLRSQFKTITDGVKIELKDVLGLLDQVMAGGSLEKQVLNAEKTRSKAISKLSRSLERGEIKQVDYAERMRDLEEDFLDTIKEIDEQATEASKVRLSDILDVGGSTKRIVDANAAISRTEYLLRENSKNVKSTNEELEKQRDIQEKIAKKKKANSMSPGEIVGAAQSVIVNTSNIISNDSQRARLIRSPGGVSASSSGASGNNEVLKALKNIEAALNQPKQIKLDANSFSKATYENQRRMIRSGQISTKG